MQVGRVCMLMKSVLKALMFNTKLNFRYISPRRSGRGGGGGETMGVGGHFVSPRLHGIGHV